jgi:hypothetical protein
MTQQLTPETKWGLGAKFVFEAHGESSRGRLLRDRGERSSAGKKGGKDGELHFDCVFVSLTDCESSCVVKRIFGQNHSDLWLSHFNISPFNHGKKIRSITCA